MTINYPFKTAIYWGADLDNDSAAQELEFANEKQFNAYREGLDQADGWMGATFVDNSAMYVNRDGDIVQRKGKSARSNENEVYVIWGDTPEIGARAETFKFDTAEEASFFKNAVMDYVGWTRYYFVPETSFRPYWGPKQALENLPEEGARSLRNYMEAQGYENEDIEHNDELIFVREDGAVVSPDQWMIQQDPENIPLTQEQYEQRYRQTLDKYVRNHSDDLDRKIDQDITQAQQGIFQRCPEMAAINFANENELPARPTGKITP